MRNFSNKKYKSAKTCNILDKNYCELVLMVIIFVPIGQHSPLCHNAMLPPTLISTDLGVN